MREKKELFFGRRKRHLRYNNLYDWFVGERVPERFVFLDDPTEREKWITQYAELRQHLFDQHVRTLVPEEQMRIKEGRHPSQSHSGAEEASRYCESLVMHLADIGYRARVSIGFYHMDRIVLTAELDHMPAMAEYGKLLPLYYDGFEIKYSGPETANSEQPKNSPSANQPAADE